MLFAGVLTTVIGSYQYDSRSLVAASCAVPNRAVGILDGYRPDYPVSAQDLGLGEVSVIVSVTVDRAGHAQYGRIVQSANNLDIDRAALQAAQKTQFFAKVIDCQAVQSQVLFRVMFNPIDNSSDVVVAGPSQDENDAEPADANTSFGTPPAPSQPSALQTCTDAGTSGAIATCYFAKHDWRNALRYLKAMDGDAIAVYDGANYEWHRAIVAEHLGDKKEAMHHIRLAYADSRGRSNALAAQIRYDYNRLGAAKIDAQAVARAARVAQQQAAAAAHEQLAENHEYWDNISYDERRVIEKYGGSRDDNEDARPCDVSVDDSAYVGHLVIWYYDCVTPDGPGRESWTFLNGVLQDHTAI